MWANIAKLAQLLGQEAHSAILPVILGSNEAALQASSALLQKGYLAPAIRFPTVARGSERLRVTVSAGHQEEELLNLSKSLREVSGPILPRQH